MRFLQTHNQGLRQLLLTVSWDAAHLTVSLYLCSSGSNAQGESRAREGRHVSSKSPSRVRDGDKGVAGKNGREKRLLDEGQIYDFSQKGNRKKIELVARPGQHAAFKNVLLFICSKNTT